MNNDDQTSAPWLEPYTSLASEVLDAVEQCRSAIAFGLSERPEDFLAIDSNRIMQTAIENCQQECESRGVTIKQTSAVKKAEVISNPLLLRRVFAFAIDCLLNDASRQSEIVIDINRSKDRLCFRFDVVSRDDASDTSETLPNRSWKLPETTGSGKAAMVLIQKHSDRLIEVSRWLRQWGATLKYECARNYQPSIEIDLACSELSRHPDVRVDAPVRPAPFSLAKQNDDA
jgi:hypothetical protein